MIPERADAESVILQKAHVIPEKREIQVDPGMNKFRDPVKDEDHRVVFVGLTNRRLEKPGIVPADGVRGKIHGRLAVCVTQAQPLRSLVKLAPSGSKDSVAYRVSV